MSELVEFVLKSDKAPMQISGDEKDTILAVFGELLCLPYTELNKHIGSVTIERMQTLYSKIKHDDFCQERGIKYEEMDEEDFLDAAFAEMEG